MKGHKELCSKLDDTFTFRLPTHLKALFRKLPIENKHEAEHKLRLVIAKAVHDFTFRPEIYLEDNGDDE